MKIHPTAIIECGAVIGDGCTIGPYCHIGGNVTLGDGCVLHGHVTLTGSTSIAERNEFYPYCCIGSRTEDLKFVPGIVTRVSIGSANVFREYCTVNAATGADASTLVGNDSTFCSDSHVGHDCLLGNRIILGCGSKLAGHVVIEDDAIINGMTGVIQFVRIGRHAFIGGVNKVTRDILPFMIADGSPAMMRVVNVIGLKRKGFDDARIARIKRIIRGLFKDGATALSEAVEALAEAYPDDADVECLRRFVADSRVGIARLGKS